MIDLVNHPPHYQGDIECIEAIEAQLTAEEYRGYLKGNIAKYLWREKMKGGTESLEKAQWYLSRLIAFDKDTQDLSETVKEGTDPDAYMTECKDGFCPMPSTRTGPPEPLPKSLTAMFDPI
jgi:hypothetical protein